MLNFTISKFLQSLHALAVNMLGVEFHSSVITDKPIARKVFHASNPASMPNEAHGVDSCPLSTTMSTSEHAQGATDNSCAMLGMSILLLARFSIFILSLMCGVVSRKGGHY